MRFHALPVRLKEANRFWIPASTPVAYFMALALSIEFLYYACIREKIRHSCRCNETSGVDRQSGFGETTLGLTERLKERIQIGRCFS